MLFSRGPNKAFLIPDSCRATERNGNSISADVTDDDTCLPFCLFLKLVQIYFIFSDNVHVLYMYSSRTILLFVSTDLEYNICFWNIWQWTFMMEIIQETHRAQLITSIVLIL